VISSRPPSSTSSTSPGLITSVVVGDSTIAWPVILAPFGSFVVE
jgi:hypothetical protein